MCTTSPKRHEPAPEIDHAACMFLPCIAIHIVCKVLATLSLACNLCIAIHIVRYWPLCPQPVLYGIAIHIVCKVLTTLSPACISCIAIHIVRYWPLFPACAAHIAIQIVRYWPLWPLFPQPVWPPPCSLSTDSQSPCLRNELGPKASAVLCREKCAFYSLLPLNTDYPILLMSTFSCVAVTVVSWF